MTDHLTDHLELTTPSDQFMNLFIHSTSYSAAVKTNISFDTFQNVQSYRADDSIKMQLPKNNDFLVAPPQKCGIKKVSKRPIYQRKSKNNLKKGNIRQKSSAQKKIKTQQAECCAQIQQKDEIVQHFQVRRRQLDEQLKKLKLKQRHTSSNSTLNKKLYQKYMAKATLTVQNYAKQKQSQENQVIIKQSNRPTQSCINMINVKSQDFRTSIQQNTQKSNRLANKLKRKLNEQIQKIKEINQATKENKEGCSIIRKSCADSRDPLRAPITERYKSKKSLARSGIQISSRDSLRNKRPQSSRKKVLQAQEMKFKIEKFQEQDNTALRGIKIDVKKHHRHSKTLYSNRYSGPQLSKTFRHISPLYMRKNWSVTKRQVEQEKLKEKMLNILIDCQNQSIKKQTIQSGIKAFQKFSKIMKKKLGTARKLINSIQHARTVTEYQLEDDYY